MSEVHIRVEGLEKAFESARHFPGAADKEIDFVMNMASSLGLILMLPDTPIKTGELRSSLFSRQLSTSSMEIGATAPHSVYVHQGTRPHEILPVRARALRFNWRGKIVFFKRVMHPGTKPNPFVKRTTDKLVKFIHDAFIQRMRIFMRLRQP